MHAGEPPAVEAVVPVVEPSPPSDGNGNRPDLEAAYFTELNQARAEAGSGPLARSGCVDRIARAWSKEMRDTQVPAHNMAFEYQIARCGDPSVVAENVGIDYSYEAVVAAFNRSSAHRANLLDPRWRFVGIGFYDGPNGSLWVTVNFTT